MHLDDLAAEVSREPRAIERRPKQLEHLFAALVRVAEMNRGAGRLDLEPRARDSFEQPGGLGIKAVERLLLGMPRDGQPAVSDQPYTVDRHEGLQLGRWTAAQDDHVGQQRNQLLQGFEGIWPSSGSGRILDDLRKGTVEVGNQD